MMVVKREINTLMKLDSTEQTHTNIDHCISQLILKKMQRQINGEKIIFSNNGTGTFGQSFVKQNKSNLNTHLKLYTKIS